MLRKLVAMLVLLVLGMVVSVAGAAVVKENINFVGPGTVSNKMFVKHNIYTIASEGTSVSSPYMVYRQAITEELSNPIGVVGKNTLRVSSTKDIKFNSEMYMRGLYASKFTLNAVNGSVNYITYADHTKRNYFRDIVVSAEKASLINDFENLPSYFGHDIVIRGTMYDVYFNSYSSISHHIIRVSGPFGRPFNGYYRSITSNITFNVPYYNISTGVPSFKGTLEEMTWAPVASNVKTSINVHSLNASNVVSISITKNVDPFAYVTTREVDISGIFNTLNNTTTFYNEYVGYIGP